MKTKLIPVLLLIAATCMADGTLCYFQQALSKAEKKAVAIDLKDDYGDTSEVDLDSLPQVYLGKTNNVFRRLCISNDQAKWFVKQGKTLPTTNSLTASISSTLTTPTNALFFAFKGMDWQTVQMKAGFKDVTNSISKEIIKP